MKTEPLLLALLALTLPAAAISPPDPPVHAPDRTELWVPTKDWDTFLQSHPSAVMLTPEQYTALVRDAGRVKPAEGDEKLITQAQVESLHFKGDARDESAGSLRLEGEMVVRCLTDEWAEVTTRMPFRNLVSVSVDGNVILGEPEGDKGGASKRKLLVRGKGAHRINFQVLGLPGTASLANTRSFGFQTTEVPAVLDLQLPPGAVVTQASAAYSREGDVVHVLLHSITPGLRDIAWTTSSAITQEARQSSATGRLTVTDHSLETDWRISLLRSSTDKAAEVAFDLIPPEAVVLNVEGEGITGWQQNAGRLQVRLRERTLSLVMQAQVRHVIDLQARPEAQSVAVPALRFAGRLDTDQAVTMASLAEGVTLMAYEGSTPAASGTLSWNPVRDTLRLLLRKAGPRVNVDADAKITVTRDEVKIDRTLQVQTDRPLNDLRATLPVGEEFLATVSTKGPALEWKRVGQTLEYRWPEALTGSAPATLTLQSRKRLNAPGGDAPAAASFKVEGLSVPEARKLAGYVALDFDPAWRVSVKDASGLEERDARTTPVQGKMAWFALREFGLAFDVKRREPVFDADVTAYALPRAKTVEIEGQITLDVSEAPLRQFKVAVTKERAALLRFTSPLVNEQTLDAASGVWSLTLRKESLGSVPVRFRLSLPADGKGASEKGDAGSVINARLPSISVNGGRRSHGVWVVEANTDTELTFEAHAMQSLDVLRAPPITGYQPRHRVVAAFDYASAEASLTLYASRHGHSELAALIVNHLKLTSVLSREGGARHEARFSLRHSGEQFINVLLPGAARPLSTIAGGNAVKPVRGPGGAVSIPLPTGSASSDDVDIRVIYETTAEAWSGSGKRQIAPPTLPGNVPVLGTEWTVFVPDGYSFKKVDTLMRQVEVPAICDDRESLPSGSPEADVSEGRIQRAAPVSAAEHVKRVQNVERSLQKANSYFDLGQYDNAAKEFQEVLRNDPYNTAARRGMERVEQKKSQYYQSVRDHRRAEMVARTDATWEDRMPQAGADKTLQKLNAIRFPSVTFSNATIDEAIEYLRVKARDLDADGDVAGRGVNIIFKPGNTPSTSEITLDLKNVPMGEALRYITELAGMKYTIQNGTIVVVPITESAAAMVTRVIKVPPEAMIAASKPDSAAAPPAPADPFSAPAEATKLPGRKTAKDILMQQGIPFPEGASAVYDPVASELVVRNSAANLDMAETFAQSVSAHERFGEAGLLPLEIDLPAAGQSLRFEGELAPQPITLCYTSGDRQVVHALLFVLAGAALFWLLGRRRPVLSTLLAVLLLALGIGLVAEEWQPLANALLVGWLATVLLVWIWNLAKAFDAGVMEGREA